MPTEAEALGRAWQKAMEFQEGHGLRSFAQEDQAIIEWGVDKTTARELRLLAANTWLARRRATRLVESGVGMLVIGIGVAAVFIAFFIAPWVMGSEIRLRPLPRGMVAWTVGVFGPILVGAGAIIRGISQRQACSLIFGGDGSSLTVEAPGR